LGPDPPVLFQVGGPTTDGDGLNGQGTHSQKRKEKKRSNTSSPLSHNSSSNTVSTIQSFETTEFVSENVGPETFSNDDTDKEYMCSFCQQDYSACSHDPQNPLLTFLICKHRFCRECIDSMEGLQNCPIANCRGTNHGKSLFQLDEKLIKRIIKKSCSEADGEAALNNGVITDDVAGSRRWNRLLTSG
jgi:hypothetical protein